MAKQMQQYTVILRKLIGSKTTLIIVFSISLALITTISFLYLQTNHKQSVQSFIENIGAVLGVQSDASKQIQALRSSKIREANKFLSTAPRPLTHIKIEGKLDTDPEKKQSIASVEDMQRIYLLSNAYILTSDSRYLIKSKEYMLAWANTYIPSGNPIDESHLKSFFEGYRLIRPNLESDVVDKIDQWLISIALKEMSSKYNDDRDVNNWNSNRIDIIGQIAFITGDEELINSSIALFKKQISENLYADGSSHDFYKRDSVSYHCYNIVALLRYAKTAQMYGINLYDYESTTGSSLSKSVEFIIPYVTGEKLHKELENSTVPWDKNTYNARKKVGGSGIYFQPKEALNVLELAYYFDDRMVSYIRLILNNSTEFPSFSTMTSYLDRQIIYE